MLLGIFLISNVTYAGNIVGTIEVLDKEGEKPLKSFANSLVFIEGIETPAPDEPVVMDQKKKQFQPRLLPVVKGQEVLITNSERLLHNAFSPHEEEPFDTGSFGKGKSASVTLNVSGTHKIYCNIHQRMIGDIYVLPNRYFAVTDKAGKFTITDVPEGEYTLKVWHIYGGADERTIQVTTQPIEVNFVIASQKKIRELQKHTNKHGGFYRSNDSSSGGGSSY